MVSVARGILDFRFGFWIVMRIAPPKPGQSEAPARVGANLIPRIKIAYDGRAMPESAPHAVTAIIPARYDSVRFPGKMLADRTGKPLIQHVYERAVQAKLVNRVI